MKKLLTTTALVALTSLPLAAENHAATHSMSDMTFETNMGAEIKVSSLMGRTVYVPRGEDDIASWTDITDAPDTWDNVADIDDILINKDGQVGQILIDAGGFLGLGEKDVRIELDQLAFVPDGDDEGEYFIVYTGTKQLLEDSDEYDQATAEGEGYMSARETMNADADANMENENMPMDRTQLQETDLASVTTEQLEGVRVYGSNDEWVGEIDTLVMGEDGNIAEVIVDVGGFLGLGEKPVAMKLDQITFMSSDGMLNDISAYVEATEEELEGMPEWEEVN